VNIISSKLLQTTMTTDNRCTKARDSTLVTVGQKSAKQIIMDDR